MVRFPIFWRRIAGAVAAVLLLALLLFYTPPGLAMAGRLAAPLSGGAVRVTGLGGLFPNRLHAGRIEIADSDGVWLRIDNAALHWSALAILANHVAVQAISADRITVLRRPLPSGEAGGETPRLDIENLALPRIVLAAPVIGHAVTLTVSGALHYVSLHQMRADLLVTRIGSTDRYRIAGGIAQDVAQGNVELREGADGIAGRLAGLPGLGPVNLRAAAEGGALSNRLSLTLSAGPLQAQGGGTIQLAAQRADLDLHVSAPAMAPRPDMRWQALSGQAHVHGRFDAPLVQADLTMTGGAFAGVAVRQVTASVHGGTGQVELNGALDEVTLPGAYADLFAQAPVRFRIQADLKAASRPVTFVITHPLVSLHGLAQTRGATRVTMDVAVPALAPLAAREQIDLRGSAGLHVALSQAASRLMVAMTGTLDAQGSAIPAQLLGRHASLALDAVIDGADLIQSRIRLQGAAIASDVNGSLKKGVLDYRLGLQLTDLSRLAPPLLGSVSLQGGVHGPMEQAQLAIAGSAVLATKGFARQRTTINLQATGLPTPRQARLTLDGRLDDAPLALRATLDGASPRRASIKARWKSLNASADLALGKILSGKLAVTAARLSDLAVFTGNAIGGTLDASAILAPQGGKSGARWQAQINDLQVKDATAQHLLLHGAIADVTGKPVLGIAADAQGLAMQGFHGAAQAHLDGPLDRLTATLTAVLKDPSGLPATGDAAVLADIPGHQVTVNRLRGAWRGVALTLDAPTTIHFGDTMRVDHLAVHLGHGAIAAAGSLSPKLALTASAHDIALQDFRPFLPQLGIQGTVSATAALDGTLGAPQGTITLQGRDLRAAFSSRAVPSASFDARAQLSDGHVLVAAALAAGSHAHLALNGTVPLARSSTMALKADGSADLALLDPLLAASGRRLRGTLTFDGGIVGTPAAPRVTGGAQLVNGEIQDQLLGFRLSGITAALRADGTRLLLTSLTGQAGQGNVTGSGSIDLAAPGMPVAMTLEARNARPLSSDLFTATITGNVKLSGDLQTQMAVSGQMQVTGGEINLPENFPPDVAVLNVRRRGQSVLPPPAPQSRLALDIAVRTTGPVFVRGHGMDAVMGGTIRVGGTSDVPLVDGSLRMERGSYSVAGQTLDFTSGRIHFDGTGLRRQLDPALDFVAQTVSAGVTATLTVGGYASAPKITLSSAPTLPQDEVVAHLLFQQSVKQLTPLQLASIAQAVASMGGIGGGFNPLGTVRRTLGLDRLAVGSTTGGASGTQSQTTVEAGRYVARNVYVGVKQNLSGGTQTQVQVDITRRLKAQATLSTGSSTTTTQGNALQDNGSSVGLSYSLEY